MIFADKYFKLNLPKFYSVNCFFQTLALQNKQTIKKAIHSRVKVYVNYPSTSFGAVLRSKLVNGRYQDQSPVALVDQAVRNFLWFSRKLALIQARILQKDPPWRTHSCRPRSQRKLHALNLQSTLCKLYISEAY